MAVFYELWDLGGGERMGEYDSLATALREVREGIDADGEEIWQAVGLLKRDMATDSTEKVADGEALVALAHETANGTVRRPLTPASRA
jgi:hypothetical protein